MQRGGAMWHKTNTNFIIERYKHVYLCRGINLCLEPIFLIRIIGFKD